MLIIPFQWPTTWQTNLCLLPEWFDALNQKIRIHINVSYFVDIITWSTFQSVLCLESHSEFWKIHCLGGCSIACRRCSSPSCKYCGAASFCNNHVICCMLKTLLMYLYFAFMFHSVTNHCSWQMVKGCSLIYQQMWYWMVVVVVMEVMEATCEKEHCDKQFRL